MSRKKRRKRYRGHWCWCCGRIRANEKFSGKGHARHLCRDCARLGADELEVRQALRNLERCVDLDGMIRRKQRNHFHRFLEHQNPRVRAAAQEMLAADARLRAQYRVELEREMELEEEMYERDQQLPEYLGVNQQERPVADGDNTAADAREEIPF